jgi:hypothetical protein
MVTKSKKRRSNVPLPSNAAVAVSILTSSIMKQPASLVKKVS